MTDNIIRKAHTGEAGNSGEFGTHTRTEASITLPTASKVEIGPYDIYVGDLEPLPEWPASLGERDLSWSYDDVSGDPAVTLKVGENWVSTYGNEGDVYTTIDDDGDENWTVEERNAIEATLLAADERGRSVVGRVEYDATNAPGIHEALTALISDQPVPAVPTVALPASTRKELEDALAAFDKAAAKFAEDTQNGNDATDEDYDALRDAKYDFAENTEALLRRLLGR